MGLTGKLIRKAATTRVAIFGMGAGVMYLFDPDRGHSRRARLASQIEGTVRGQVRSTTANARRRAHYTEGRVKGMASRARGQGHYHPESQVDLREHLRQVLHTLPIPTGDVTVDVFNGKVSLRGQVQTEEHRARVRAAVTEVDGVSEVEDFLHLPGTVAPNKAEVLRLST